jgi:hypothetical protein
MLAPDEQLVPVVFSEGLDTKTDPKQVVPGKLTALENVVFTKLGALTKRTGHTLLDNLKEELGAYNNRITSATNVASFNDELLIAHDGQLSTYISSRERWSARGNFTPCVVSRSPVVHNDTEQSDADSAYGSGYALVVSDNYISFVDVETGAEVFGLTTEIQQPRVVHFPAANKFVCFYTKNSGADLYYTAFDYVSGLAPASEVNVATGLVGLTEGGVYDAIVVGNKLVFAYGKLSGTNRVHLNSLDSNLVLGTPVVTTAAARNFLTLCTDAALRIWYMSASATGSAVQYGVYGYDLATEIQAPASAQGRADVVRTAGLVDGDTLHIFTDSTEFGGVAGTQMSVKYSSVVLGGATAAGVDILNVSLLTRPFTYDGRVFAGVVFESDLQTTAFIIDTLGSVVAKVHPQQCGAPGHIPTDVWSAESGKFTFATQTRGRVVTDNGEYRTIQGVDLFTLDFASAEFSATVAGGSLVIAGAVTRAYDGANVTELGFHLFPEGVTVDIDQDNVSPDDTAHLAGYNMFFEATGTAGTGATPTSNQVGVTPAYRIRPGTYFTGETLTKTYYVWFSVDGNGVDPDIAGSTGFEVAVASTDLAADVTAEMQSVLSADAEFTNFAISGANSETLTWDNNANGATAIATVPAYPDGAGTGFVDLGTYQYIAVYESTDRPGQIHRSAVSVPVTAIYAGVTGSSPAIVEGGRDTIAIRIPCLPITDKESVRVAVYRTENLGNIFFKVTDDLVPVLNDTGEFYVSVVDPWSDEDLITREVLYIHSAKENTAPPLARYVTTHANRVFCVAPQANTVWYSHILVRNEPVTFNDEFFMDVDPTGGFITAIASLDDKMVIFKRNRIFVVSGSGPTNMGMQNDFSEPHLVAPDVGCISHRSVVAISAGLLFQSAKGIYLLDRGLNVSYIGAPAEGYNGETITSAKAIPDSNRVQFTTESGTNLVYDTLFDKWGTFTGMQAIDATIWNETYTYVRADGRVLVGDSSVYKDGNVGYGMSLTTGWMPFAGLQAFQRVKRCYFLGDYKGTHELRLEFAYDHEAGFTDVVDIDAGAICHPGTYGESSPYGAGTYGGLYGGPHPDYQFDIHLRRQKCQAIRVRITENQRSDFNEGAVWSGMSFRVKQKAGQNKKPVGRKFGASSQ